MAILGCGAIASACGGSSSSNPTTSTAAAAPTASTVAASATAAGTALVAAFDTLDDQLPAFSAAQNGTNAQSVEAAWVADSQARESFDSTVRSISFPSGVTSGVQAILSADGKVESIMNSLAVEIDNPSAYRVSLAKLGPAEEAIAAAAQPVFAQLGVSLG
jgi:hypothetical protein